MKSNFSVQNNTKLKVKDRSTIEYLDISKITHLICEGYITTIYMIDMEPIIVSKLLKCFELSLKEFEFIRANRSTLVNMAFARKYIGGSRRILELVNGCTIEVSRRMVYKFK